MSSSPSKFPQAIEHLVQALTKLPGVGRRGAERMAFSLLKQPEAVSKSMANSLSALHQRIDECEKCGFLTEDGVCAICSDSGRDQTQLCIVEDDLDVFAFEKSGGIAGLYHVLGGCLSPLKGITPSDLSFQLLMKRLDELPIQEIIIATSPTVEGDATALYLNEILEDRDIRVTQIGRGLPMGGNLEYTDSGTLRLALESRRPFN